MLDKSEVYISVDIESSGPIPGKFSMLSLGACVVKQPAKTFYAEFKPLDDNFIGKSLEVTGLSMEELKAKGEKPIEAMSRFEKWILEVAGENKPVFVAFNATFDWSFTHWYFINFLGRDPFGISGLDIKAYFMGKHNISWSETVKKKVSSLYPSKTPHTHNALDDAIEQAEIFDKMLKLGEKVDY